MIYMTKSEINAAMLEAVAGKDMKTFRLALAAGADVDAANRSGFTALMGAAGLGEAEFVKLLIAGGVNVDAVYEKVGYTALMVAAKEGFAECVKLLLEAGADPDMLDNRGRSAMGLAIAAKQMECIEVLSSSREALLRKRMEQTQAEQRKVAEAAVNRPLTRDEIVAKAMAELECAKLLGEAAVRAVLMYLVDDMEMPEVYDPAYFEGWRHYGSMEAAALNYVDVDQIAENIMECYAEDGADLSDPDIQASINARVYEDAVDCMRASCEVIQMFDYVDEEGAVVKLRE